MARAVAARCNRYVVDTRNCGAIEWRTVTSVSAPDGKPHVPAPSLWPIGFAIGVVCLLVGFVISWWGVVIGAVLAVVFGFLWAYDLTRGMRELEHAPPPGASTVAVADEPAPAPEDEAPTYSRSIFLELSTLGVGGIIGGLVTLPALGFAVIPAFEHEKHKDVDLGPLSNFPEGQYVVTTFLEDPSQGEVTRKTAFIRNNGVAKDPATGKQVPSFTIIYSRCAHLGCPVQPGAVLDDSAAKTLKTKPAGEEVKLIKTEGLTGFGCPCHGGQYDAEGNRTAGPPVRSLDRFAYSVVNGNLVLGTLYSVAHVDGQGSAAKIRRYTSASPGVHVDGWERWLYPIPVPGR
jgi:menaquinol-cytochrome c reductase iron-sulfur subunit